MVHQDIIKMLEQEWRDRLEEAVKQEREACAKVCDDNQYVQPYRDLGNLIRARGETTLRGEQQ